MKDVHAEVDLSEATRQRLAEGVRQIQRGEGVERPEWTRFVDEPDTLEGRIGDSALQTTQED